MSNLKVNTKASNKASNKKDTPVTQSATPATPAKTPKAPKAPAIYQNGVRKPVKGLCADVWVWVASQKDLPTIAQVVAWGTTNKLNINNCKIEYYAYRKFHGLRGVNAVSGVTLAPASKTA